MDMIRKMLAFGLGLASVSKEQAEKLVDELVKRGELSLEESKDVIDQWIRQKEEGKAEFQRAVREQLKQMLDKLDLATKEDIRQLEERIQRLEQKNE
ncbi:hypothetical protein GFC29_736 [Anoxybacillus sp. B7M1]|jgi:polyhydroxyalkanoate synthesis regulator phasin|uniref:Polyhydroxyalkanoate synthesis regulator n=1 Tax=Anoxybacteroides rupiense TaxID=311460 RepID=A0ABD5IUW6_9BACL|nr:MULTISPECIES: ATP synthase subunit B [Anoxybacillus]ANB57315.1 hypothetical protein GFC28_890 [Anoxybacillus sp. B2M1]ANB62909.1 hypothetical protein GFC29_736 [Anoxybacillus sp. B7M1]MBS2772405.1 polyhydroxyalkanoate synthesis regulator [Anoxybacillus rupiensis]MDE8564042.1 polyhydroxyalkanoate synthesis regulator [Anoxybacillus rupiensis]MED5051565.1 polyhydroxyalkanoate synthesis regulator [Anoxybacillus rupiensis]